MAKVTLRQYYAARAPKAIPTWFSRMFPYPEGVNPPGKEKNWDLEAKHQQEVYFKWRWFYADTMVGSEPKTETPEG